MIALPPLCSLNFTESKPFFPIRLQEGYEKAYYRLACSCEALNEVRAAIDACTKGSALHGPLEEELSKMKSKLESLLDEQLDELD